MRQNESLEPRERLRIVFEGLLEDRSIAEICRRNDISSCEYYRWREKVFRNAERIFHNGS